MKNNSFLSKENVGFLKGIAIIFMFIRHFFFYPKIYISGISYPKFEPFIPIYEKAFDSVAIFAFITGYVYFFVKKKDFNYSIKKIINILITYYVIFILFFVISLFTKTYNLSIYSLLLEIFMIENNVVPFSWYILFYIICILLLPYISKKFEKLSLSYSFGIIFLIIFLLTIILNIFSSNNYIYNIVYNLIRFLPTLLIGYLFAHHSLFNILDNKLHTNKLKYYLICFIILIISFYGKYYFLKIIIGNIVILEEKFGIVIYNYIFYIPLFIYSIIVFSKFIPKFILNIISRIGEYSLYMWLCHGIFFNISKRVFMPILFSPKNPILVLLWGLLLTCMMSFVIKKIIDFLMSDKVIKFIKSIVFSK